jgi:hypothetical protein
LYEDKTLGRCPKPYHLLKNKALLPLAKASLWLANRFVGAMVDENFLFASLLIYKN